MTRGTRVLGLLIGTLLAAGQALADVVEVAGQPTQARDAAGLPRAPAGPVSAVLVDVATGRVLYAREMHRRLPPASTTKILTAVVVIERLSPRAIVTISHSAAAVRTGSVIGVEAGQRWPVDDLLHLLLMRSANDAAVALAEAAAGGIPRFSDLMNAKARALGARASHFTNPSGLHDPRHYTTAHDLALVTRYALHHPRFAGIVRLPVWTLYRPGEAPRDIVNTNKLLAMYAGADGVKTGHTPAAGYTFAGSASRNGWQLLAVVLKSQDMYGDVSRLLDYGFQHFAPRQVARRGEAVASLPIGRARQRLIATVSQDVLAVTRRGAVVATHVSWRPGLQPPIAAGARVGTVQFVEGNAVIASATLFAANHVSR
jgi:D-alanyl-D-alanine carboxypeptidase (penicillin-binding protein 5/6)